MDFFNDNDDERYDGGPDEAETVAEEPLMTLLLDADYNPAVSNVRGKLKLWDVVNRITKRKTLGPVHTFVPAQEDHDFEPTIAYALRQQAQWKPEVASFRQRIAVKAH